MGRGAVHFPFKGRITHREVGAWEGGRVEVGVVFFCLAGPRFALASEIYTSMRKL